MIEEYFLTLDRDSCSRYSIEASAQIEPASAEDPDELYRMTMHRVQQQHLTFDVVFYPDRVDVQTPAGHTVGEIQNDNIESADELADRLDTYEPYLNESRQFE